MMMTLRNTLRLLAIAFCLVDSDAKSRKRIFKSTSNFDNLERWSGGRLPCAGDKVLFDNDKMVSVFVQTNATITEMVLPMNGEFIFDDDITWGSSNELSDCTQPSGQDSVFDATSDDWFDGAKWETDGIKSSLDVLDVEIVPCDFDDIEFPSKNSWTIYIPLDSRSSSLRIWEKSYLSDTFATYRATVSGRYQFQGVGALATIGGSCVDNTGCPCRSVLNAETIETTICNHVSCSSELCQNPMYPVGQCCSTCGALLTMSYSLGYSENKMTDLLNQLTSNSKYSLVHFALSKIKSSSNKLPAITNSLLRSSSDYIQILMRDEETGTDHGSTAKAFAQELMDILLTTEGLGVSNVTLSSSGEGVAPQSSLGGGAIVGIVIGVICGIVLLVGAGLYLPKRCQQANIGFSHRKFKNEQDNFSNPLYDMGFNGVESIDKMSEKNPIKSSSVTGIPQVSALTSDFGISFGNPMYEEEDV